MNDKISLIDTNLLAYAYGSDKKSAEKNRICKKLVTECWNGKKQYAVSLQNLSEFYVVVTEKTEHPIPKKDASTIIEDMLSFRGWKKINYTADTIPSAIKLNQRHGTHYWDALLAATMQENNITDILTENTRDFQKIPWITAENPLQKVE